MNNIYLKIELVILCLFVSTNLFAQTSIFRHYSVMDGLPSSEIYAQVQDSDGYIWFGTSKGLSRFDGYEFKNYTIKDGLPANSVIDIYKDYTGKLWFSTYDGSLSYLLDDKIYEYEYNDTVKNLAKNYFINNIYIDTLNNLWMMPFDGGLYKITSKGIVSEINDNYKGNYTFSFRVFDNGYIWNDNKAKHITDTLLLINKENTFYINFPSSKVIRKYIYKIADNRLLVSYGNSLLYINNNEIITVKKFENEISGIYADIEGNFWISVMYEGVYLFYNGDLNSKPNVFLKRKSPISVFQDREGNYWLSTTEDGVYFIPSLQFKTYKQFGFSDFNILSIEIFNNIMYFSTYDKQVFKCNIHEDKILSLQNIPLRTGRDYAINDIVTKSDGSVWFIGKELFKMSNNQVFVIDTIARGYKLFESYDNGILLTCNKGFVKYKSDTLSFRLSDDNITVSNAILQDKNGIIYLGTINGLFSFKNDKLINLGEEIKFLQKRIKHYICITNNI